MSSHVLYFCRWDAQVMITTGTLKHYSNGIDLVRLATYGDHTKHVEFMRELCETLLRIVLFPMPTIALVNGN